MKEINYGSVITEQGDLGLGVMPILENENQEDNDNKQSENKKEK